MEELENDDYDEIDLGDIHTEAVRAGEALGRLLAAAITKVLEQIDLNHIIREEISDAIRDAAASEIEDVLKDNKLLILTALGGAIPSALEERQRKQKNPRGRA